MKKLILFIVVAILLVLLAFYPGNREPVDKKPSKSTQVVKKTEMLYGIPADSFEVVRSIVRPGQTLSHLLTPHLNNTEIYQLVQLFKDRINLENIRAGDKYTIFLKNDSSRHPAYFVYEPDEYQYWRIKFDSIPSLEIIKKSVTFQPRIVAGSIQSSLFETLEKINAPVELAIKMSEIYAWTIDFYRLQKNDSFIVYYQQEFIEDKPYGVGRIIAAKFKHAGQWINAYYFVTDSAKKQSDYFDEKGMSLRKSFLKAPVKFSRISSRYSLKRFHPVQKRFKAHLGTDYAAPKGTPIYATGDGVVIEAKFKIYNGNYVKIRHNSTYTTQYLHMSKIAPGIRPGVHVRQGQVIGYVGSTGLATGPHVCYRFWKNGKQVDPLKEKFPAANPVPDSLKENFSRMLDQLNEKMDSLLSKSNPV
ncbi:MAG: peptidase M23 [Vicingaceae bacterium]|nr:MAG: peptidase M23 [Vicingaceae bacterium]